MKTTKIATIIICTHNRDKHLQNCISALIAELDSTPVLSNYFDILVNLNCCTDNSLNICEELKTSISNFQYIIEPTLGLSHARNSATKHAKTPWIIFLDDDGIPRKNFLKTALDTIQNYNFDCFGGTYYPQFEASQIPKWLPPNFGSNKKNILTTSILPDNDFVSGGIMAIKKEIIIEFGMFKTNLGCIGKVRKVGEETFLQIQMRKQGYKIGFNPQWEMDHFTPNSKLTLKFSLEKEKYEEEFWRYVNGKGRFTLKQKTIGIIKSTIKLFIRKNYYKENFIIDICKFFY